MAGENATVRQMESAAHEATLYTITKAQAERALKKMGHGDKFVTAHPDPLLPTDRMHTFLAGEHARELQDAGGTEGKTARVATKYLRYEGSETTIPLTSADVKALAAHGVKLKKA